MKSLQPLSLAIALTISASALAGLSEPGVDVKSTRNAMANVAICIVKKHHDEAAAVILSDKDSAKMRSDFIKLASKSDCPKQPENAGALLVMMLGGNFHFAVAEALVAADHQATVTSLAGAPIIPSLTYNPATYEPRPGRKYSDEQLRSLERETKRAQALAELTKFGDCVVRTDTTNAQRLLLTKVESAGENQAFGELRQSLSKCLVQGQTVSLDKSMSRGALGFAFYRLANAPRVVAGGAS